MVAINQMNSTYRNVITGPRWAKFPTAIRSAAFEAGLDLKMDVEKHLIRETVRFEVSGPSNIVEAFQSALLNTIQEWNK